MTALYALVHLIIGPSSESRCLCTYKAFMDAHAHDASGQSMKLTCRYSKAGCTFQNMSWLQYNTIHYNTIQYNTIQYNTIQYNTIQYNTIQYKQSAVLDSAAASPDQEATLAGFTPSSADAVRRVAPRRTASWCIPCMTKSTTHLALVAKTSQQPPFMWPSKNNNMHSNIIYLARMLRLAC